MFIKTTLNLKFSQACLLYEVAERFNLSLSFVINSLAHKIFKSHSFSARFLQSVQYQSMLSDEDDFWKRVPVSFEVDVYEKCLDLRKVFKISVSRAFAFGIKKLLNELIRELENGNVSDNYSHNYFFLYKGSGDFSQIILLWDIIDEEKLKKLYKLHTET